MTEGREWEGRDRKAENGGRESDRQAERGVGDRQTDRGGRDRDRQTERG